MFALSGLFKKSQSSSFFGTTFDQKGLHIILFKDGYPLAWAHEHLTSGVVLNGSIVDKDHFCRILNVGIERCLSEQPGEDAKDIYFGISGSASTEVFTAARKKLNPEENVSKKVLSEIYNEIELNSMDTALTEVFQTTGNRDAHLENILTETTSIKLDGKIVYNPTDFKGQLLDAEVFNAYCSPAFVNIFESVSKGSGQLFKGVFPLQYLLSKRLRSKLGDYFDGTLISVYPDFTEVSVVFGGNLIKSKTLPLSASTIEKDLDLWMDGLALTYEEFDGVKTFSNNIYVCGTGLEKTEFWEMLEWREWEEKIPFKTKPSFTKLDAGFLDLPQGYKEELLFCGLLSICKELA